MQRVWETIARFVEPPAGEELPPPIVDLLLDPAPDAAQLAATLAPFGFARPAEALATLQDLATERVPFLSTRRCRDFLSLIVERLLEQIAATPDPDWTLSNLGRVSDSLGGKGVLWELFSFHPPSLHLYVRLCAASPYLSDILTTNPGMIDDLLDSLQLDRLPTLAELQSQLAALSRGTTDTLPILHDLKNASHLRIGVRDILGQESIESTHAALADVAEFCLDQVARREYVKLVEKFGPPTIGPGPYEGEPCQSVILALGKLGGREPNYHSSVEVAFLYEAEGTTRPPGKNRRDQRTANNHFFTQLAQRVLKEVSQLTPQGSAVLGRAAPAAHRRRWSDGPFVCRFLAAFRLRRRPRVAMAGPLPGPAHVRLAGGPRSGRGDGPAANRKSARQRSRPGRDLPRAPARRSGAAELNLKRGCGGTLDVESLAQCCNCDMHPLLRPC